jgi:hypothetical protein
VAENWDNIIPFFQFPAEIGKLPMQAIADTNIAAITFRNSLSGKPLGRGILVSAIFRLHHSAVLS